MTTYIAFALLMLALAAEFWLLWKLHRLEKARAEHLAELQKLVTNLRKLFVEQPFK